MPKRVSLLVAFAKDRRGSVAVIFGLALLPTMMMAGAAIDYAGAARGKSALQAAADVAVIAAAKAYEDNVPANASATTIQQAKTKASQTGQSVFQSNVPANVQDAAIAIALSEQTGAITATGTYSGKARAHFSKLMGLNDIAISGTAKAAYPSLNKNVFIFVDNTHSMKVGANQAERDRLTSLTRPGCAFSCHGVTQANINQGQGVSNAAIAESNGVKLRIDVVREGVRRLVDSIRSSALAGKIYMDIFRMDFGSINVAIKGATPLPIPDYDEELTNNYGALGRRADSIAATQTDSTNSPLGRTPMEEFFSYYFDRVSNQGAGGQKYALIITDGVRDRPRTANGLPTSGFACANNGDLCVSPFDSALCDQFKNAGATVAVIHMPYPAIPGSALYNATVGVIGGQVEPNLRSCAAPGFYFRADTSLNAAVDAFFNKIQASKPIAPRLIQ